MGIEFAVNIAQVSFDRVQRKVKPGSGLGIGQFFGDELKYLQFAPAQEFNQVRFWSLSFRKDSMLRFDNVYYCSLLAIQLIHSRLAQVRELREPVNGQRRDCRPVAGYSPIASRSKQRLT